MLMFIAFSAMGILCNGSNKEFILKYYFKAVALFGSIDGVHNLIGYHISHSSIPPKPDIQFNCKYATEDMM